MNTKKKEIFWDDEAYDDDLKQCLLSKAIRIHNIKCRINFHTKLCWAFVEEKKRPKEMKIGRKHYPWGKNITRTTKRERKLSRKYVNVMKSFNWHNNMEVFHLFMFCKRIYIHFSPRFHSIFMIDLNVYLKFPTLLTEAFPLHKYMKKKKER